MYNMIDFFGRKYGLFSEKEHKKPLCAEGEEKRYVTQGLEFNGNNLW
jgi:hypothetical protein